MAGEAGVLKSKFPERYPGSGEPRLYRAPGRVNLIGEHTDYTEGLVMPIALEAACYVAAAPSSSDGKLRIYSEDIGQGAERAADSVASITPQRDWTDYVFGVAQQLAKRGMAVEPKDVLIHSSVPVGAGVSSSAALEIATALALSDGKVLEDRMELARIGKAAENEFVGMPCGIMDQFISVFGQAHAAIKIDCRTLEYEEVPLPDNVAIIAVNSMVKHELGGSAYRDRVAECGQALAHIQQSHPEVKSLRDAKLAMIDQAMAEVPRKRARHVVSENARVEDFAKASRAGDRNRMGELFVGSHRSLQHDYEVSCEELDFLVDAALGVDGVFGARMTGGGFGGCTVNLVEPAKVEAFARAITSAYQQKYGKTPKVFECKPSAGAGVL
ncbi:MAG: galactokinase [Acidobacteria bacterium]|nr:galactokinase [Acidobacteriota bacterium]